MSDSPDTTPRVWMPMFWRDYFADTRDFSAEEHGAYLCLIGYYWMNGGPIPNDRVSLLRAANLSGRGALKTLNRVVSKFQVDVQTLRHKRVDAELEIARGNKAKAVKKAKKAADARWKDHAPSNAPSNASGMLQGMLEQCPPPSPSPSLPLKEVEIAAAPPSPSLLDGLSDEIKTDPEAKHFDLSQQDLGSGRFRLKKFPFMWMHFWELTDAREKFTRAGLDKTQWLDSVKLANADLEGKQSDRRFRGGLAFKYLCGHILTDALNQKKSTNQANGFYGPQPKPTPARRSVRSESRRASPSQPVPISSLLGAVAKPTE